MRMKNKVGAVVFAITLFSGNVSAKLMTVAEFEAQQTEIMNSDLEHAQKLKKIQDLSELFDATQALKDKIEATRQVKSASAAETGNTSPQSPQQTAQSVGNTLAVSMKVKASIEQKILDEIFMTELGVIGPVGNAVIIAQNRKYPIDLSSAISSKRVYGNYTIKSFTDDSITVTHVDTHKNKVLMVEDAATITAQIDFNRNLLNEYTQKALIGQLDVEISNQANSALPTPQTLMY